jgi:predicted SAM-dependent methyltransferase
LYRIQEDRDNSYLRFNKDIQKLQKKISNQYIYSLISEWCRRENLPMYDLGGGINCAEGYLSVDLRNADVTCDIRQGLPFKDNSVGCIRASDFLEHIPSCYDSTCTHGQGEGELLCTVGLMNEIYRVLAPNGWFLSATPSTDGRGAFQDPTHVSFWNPNSFWYYSKRNVSKYVAGIQCRFQANRVWQSFPSKWHEENNILYVYADMVAIKGQQQIGIWDI